MRIALFYFSATGNSLMVCRELSKALEGKVEIYSLSDQEYYKVDKSYDIVGIIAPVYIGGLPCIVHQFLENLEISSQSFVFGVVTHGGMPGASLMQMNNFFKKKNLILSCGFEIRMPSNYAPLKGAISLKKQNRLFLKALNKIKRIAEPINKREFRNLEGNNFIIRMFLHKFIYKKFISKLKNEDKKFWVNEKCMNCGICEKVCPVNNITLDNGEPKWLHNCELCFACFQWCPQEAIEFSSKTKNRKRYVNPNVKLKDFLRR